MIVSFLRMWCDKCNRKRVHEVFMGIQICTICNPLPSDMEGVDIIQ